MHQNTRPRFEDIDTNYAFFGQAVFFKILRTEYRQLFVCIIYILYIVLLLEEQVHWHFYMFRLTLLQAQIPSTIQVHITSDKA